MTTQNLLSVRNLSVDFPMNRYQGRNGPRFRAVNGVSLDIRPNEILGLVGESGAGKSLTGLALMGLISAPAHMDFESYEFNGKSLNRAEVEELRGHTISMVFQDPQTSLNPLRSVGDVLVESILRHVDVTPEQARAKALSLLKEVGIPAAEDRLDNYPHEFSGGMRQRVVIALALATEPQLIIADEPTTALDVSVQAQVIGVLKSLSRDKETSVVLVTHDMGVIAESTDRVAVMYAGHIVEIGSTEDVLSNPKHPYTKGLLSSTPSIERARDEALYQIPGAMPRPGSIPEGCPFAPRCDRVMDQCRAVRPELRSLSGDREAACYLFDEAGEIA